MPVRDGLMGNSTCVTPSNISPGKSGFLSGIVPAHGRLVEPAVSLDFREFQSDIFPLKPAS
jgi:hypothetical protein